MFDEQNALQLLIASWKPEKLDKIWEEPEMWRSICSEENLGLRHIYYFHDNPIYRGFNWSS